MNGDDKRVNLGAEVGLEEREDNQTFDTDDSSVDSGLSVHSTSDVSLGSSALVKFGSPSAINVLDASKFPTLSEIATYLGYSDCRSASSANVVVTDCDSAPFAYALPGRNVITNGSFILSVLYHSGSNDVRQNFKLDENGYLFPVGRSSLYSGCSPSTLSSCEYFISFDYPLYYAVEPISDIVLPATLFAIAFFVLVYKMFKRVLF